MPTFVIVGAGLAGAKAAESLRDKGFDGKIIVFGSEDHLPYERPPLSKDYLAGDKSLADFTVHPAEWYREHDIRAWDNRTKDGVLRYLLVRDGKRNVGWGAH